MKNKPWKKIFGRLILATGFMALFTILLKSNNPNTSEPLLFKNPENSDKIHVSPIELGRRDVESHSHTLEIFTLKSDGYLLIIKNTQGG